MKTQQIGQLASSITALRAATGLARRASVILIAIFAILLTFAPKSAYAQASITSPSTNVALPLPTFSLYWNKAGQVENFIYLGSSQGQNDYYGGSMGTNSSVNFTWPGAPASVWVRLWSRMPIYSGNSGSTVAYYQWQARDYFYQLGQQQYDWKLPFPGGYTFYCTARANDPGDSGHQGANYYSLDFAKGGARIWPSTDTPIYALHGGKVLEVFTGPLDYARNVWSSGTPRVALHGFPPNGYFVRLDADGDGNSTTGLVTVYCHLKYPPSLKKGDTVTAGQQIGVMGSTGASTGEHLHMTFRFDGSGTSPSTELDKIRIENLAIKDFKTWSIYGSTR